MTDLFESYASDFAQLRQSIENRLAVDFSSMSAETRRSALRHADAEAEEAGELVSQMEIEVQSFPSAVRDRYVAELRALKHSLEKLQQDIVRVLGTQSVHPISLLRTYRSVLLT